MYVSFIDCIFQIQNLSYRLNKGINAKLEELKNKEKFYTVYFIRKYKSLLL